MNTLSTFFKTIYYRIKLKTPKIANRIRIVSTTLAGWGAAAVASGLNFSWHSVDLNKAIGILGVVGTICTSLMVENNNDLSNAVNGNIPLDTSTLSTGTTNS